MKEPHIPIEREHHEKYNVDEHADKVIHDHDDVDQDQVSDALKQGIRDATEEATQ